MYADPDLRGDLLAVGLALLRLRTREQRSRVRLGDIAEMLGWRHSGNGKPNWLRVKHVLADDRPRYVPSRQMQGECAAPMVRREGVCGRPTSNGGYVRDPATGEMHWLAACSRHRDWGINHHRETWDEWKRQGCPEPPANTGGVLARYIDLDWEQVYRWGDAAWRMPPSGPPPPTTPRPRLTLIVGEGEGGVVPAGDLSAVDP